VYILIKLRIYTDCNYRVCFVVLQKKWGDIITMINENINNCETIDFNSINGYESLANNRVFNVLVIDDDKMIQSVFRKFLESWKFNVYTTVDPFEGIALAIKKNPSFIILDIYLPELNGEKILKLLKKIDITANIPVIIVSGNLSRELLNSTYSEGAAGFLSKPFTREDLANNIQRVINPGILSNTIITSNQ